MDKGTKIIMRKILIVEDDEKLYPRQQNLEVKRLCDKIIRSLAHAHKLRHLGILAGDHNHSWIVCICDAERIQRLPLGPPAVDVAHSAFADGGVGDCVLHNRFTVNPF